MTRTDRTKALLLAALACMPVAPASGGEDYWVAVSNERSGDVTLIEGSTRRVVATIPAGKRPRGIHASPDGRSLYVALSGSPIGGPPALDPQGRPILKEDDEEDADHTFDGIGEIDLASRKLARKLPSGSDPEEFAVGKDGSKLYVSNEDVGTATIVDVASGKVDGLVRVRKEPEGVALSPDGRSVYVTCETGGEVVVIDVATRKAVGEIAVGGRPRTVAFSEDGSKAFIPSETEGTVGVFDTASRRKLRSIRLPEGARPMGAVFDARRQRLCVSTGRGGTICILDPFEGRVVSSIPAGKRPWGLAISPDGKTLFAANGPSNDVSAIDLDSGREVGRIAAGEGPWGVVVVPMARENVSRPGSASPGP